MTKFRTVFRDKTLVSATCLAQRALWRRSPPCSRCRQVCAFASRVQDCHNMFVGICWARALWRPSPQLLLPRFACLWWTSVHVYTLILCF